jgi:hypothetical protein
MSIQTNLDPPARPFPFFGRAVRPTSQLNYINDLFLFKEL